MTFKNIVNFYWAFLLIIVALFESGRTLSQSQYNEALKVINQTDIYMPENFVYLQWQPLIFYDIDEPDLQMKMYGFLTWVTKYSTFPQFINTSLPDNLELSLFPPFLKSPVIYASSTHYSKIKNDYPAITYLSKLGWVTVTNAYSFNLKCELIEGSYYPYEEYNCATTFIGGQYDFYCLNLKNDKAAYSYTDPKYHDCTINTDHMKYFNQTSEGEKLIRKWEPTSISMVRRQRYKKQILDFQVRMKRIPQNHVAIDALCGFTAGLTAIFQCLIPCSHKERLIVGMLSFLIYMSSLPGLDQLLPLLRAETCPLLHFYLVIGVIQIIAFLWSVVATSLWYRAGKKMKSSNDFQLMPRFMANISACLARVTLAGHLIESPEVVLAKLMRVHNQQFTKSYQKEDASAATAGGDVDKPAGNVEFSETEAPREVDSTTEPDAKLRHWHIFCLLVDRFLFATLIIVFIIGAGVFLS